MTTIPLNGLQDWYLRARDGEWSDAPGLRIATLEHGWALRVNLERAGLTGRTGPDVTINRTHDDWLHTWVDGAEFRADCGPLNLTEAIKTYLGWAGWLVPEQVAAA